LRNLLPILASHPFHAAMEWDEAAINRRQFTHRLIGILGAGIEAVSEAIMLLVVDLYTVNVKISHLELARRHTQQYILDPAQIPDANGK